MSDRRSADRIAAVIQVRYKKREDFVLEYARDISQGGIFIGTEDPLTEGETVELQLHLPGLPQPVTLLGTIVRTVRAREKGLSGMGIAFGELEEYVRATLQTYLKELEANRECVVDRRGKSVRYDQVLEVRYQSVKDFLVDYSENISKNGIFVRSEAPPPIDTIVPMKIYLPNGKVLEITGRVAHTIDPEAAQRLSHAPGMGIEFLHFHGNSQSELWNYVESLSR